MALKDTISTPLEAGTSLLETHNLPTHLNDALEYASRRLARKSLHVPLVAIRTDYQAPSAPATPLSPPPQALGPRPGFAASLRRRLSPILTSFSIPTSGGSMRSAATSPTCSVGSGASGWSKPSWPCTPATPATPVSVPPMTPCTASSGTEGGPMSPGLCGLRLVHGDALGPKDERTVRDVLGKARKKYQLGTDWLPSPVTPSAYSLPDGLIRRSLLQNDILFSSEGLTLYSLDRLYTFKSALSSYSRTRLPSRLEDAVDELRRLYLSSGGRKVKRADVLRSYDWLGVSEVALGEVDRMYRRAYGGVEGVGVIEGMRYEDRLHEIEDAIDDVIDLKMEEAGLSMLLFPNSPIETLTPICKAAPLRLQTTFDPPRKATAPQDNIGEAEEEEEELTARPEREPGPWSASIDEVLVPPRAEKHRRSGSGRSERLGPATPRAYEDISPVTRGEWGFLFSDAGFGVRTAAVETC